MRTSFYILIGLMLATGCQATSRSRGQHPDAAKTVVEIRAMAYPDPSQGERPPRTFANTDLADCKTFQNWMRRQRGSWQRIEEMPANMPLATCAMIYGDGKRVSFAVDDHVLIRGNQKLPLSDEDYQFVKRICMKR